MLISSWVISIILAILLLAIGIAYEKGIKAGVNQEKSRERLVKIMSAPEHPNCRCVIVPKGTVAIPVDKLKSTPPSGGSNVQPLKPNDIILNITIQEHTKDISEKVAQKLREEMDKLHTGSIPEPEKKPNPICGKICTLNPCVGAFCIYHPYYGTEVKEPKPDPRKEPWKGCGYGTPSGYCTFGKGENIPHCTSIICPKEQPKDKEKATPDGY